MSTEKFGNGWKLYEEYRKEGKNFRIIVFKHTLDAIPESPFYEFGNYRWNVYAYIFPNHPYFKKFISDDFWQEACANLPLHCGATYLKRRYNSEGVLQVIQVGSDYEHLYDHEYTFMDTPEKAYKVFLDGEELFDFLMNYKEEEENHV